MLKLIDYGSTSRGRLHVQPSSARSFSQRGQPEIADNAMVRGADGQLVTFPEGILRVRSQDARRAMPKTIQSTRCMVLRPLMRKVTASMAEVCVFLSGETYTISLGTSTRRNRARLAMNSRLAAHIHFRRMEARNGNSRLPR